MKWILLLAACLVGCVEGELPRATKTLIVRPNGPGSITQWLPPFGLTNWEGVNAGNPGVRAPGVFFEQIFQDMYAVTVPSPPAGIIESVRYVSHAISANPPQSVLQLMVGNHQVGTLRTALSGPPNFTPLLVEASIVMATNPVTGLAWDWTDFSTLQIGQIQDMNFINEDIRVSDVYLEVTYMPGHQFASGAPVAGIGFNFFCDADTEIMNYLRGTFTYADLQSLSTFLASKLKTIRPCRFDNELTHESPSNFPLMYLSSFLVDTVQVEPRTLAIKVQTDIRIWSSRPNPQETMVECDQIASAVLSMFRQNDFDRDGHVWTVWYNDMPQDAGNSVVVSPAVVEAAPDGTPTGRVRTNMTLTWIHAEDV